MTDADTFRLYLGDLVKLLLETARAAKAAGKADGSNPTDIAFSKGEAFGVYMVLSTMINQAMAFDIPLDEIGLAGLDPENESTSP